MLGSKCVFTLGTFIVCSVVRARRSSSQVQECEPRLIEKENIKVRIANEFRKASPTEWQYIAEGALNVALAYKGSRDILKGYVLRVRKDNSHAAGGKKCPPNPWKAYNEFVDTLIVPLLGRRYVQPSVEVPLGSGFIALLAKHIEEDRPIARRKYQLDTSLRVGLLMIDNTNIPSNSNQVSICFEIKPKWGFLPTSQWVSHEVKRRFGRFTMQQHYKIMKGERDVESKYNPLELFSNEKDEIRNALSCLVETPQNNFRLFVDSFMAFPDAQGHGSQEMMDVELAKLNFKGGTDRLLQVLAEILHREPLLERIKAAQMLDDYDIEVMWPIYQDLEKKGSVPTLLTRREPLLPRPVREALPHTEGDKLESFHRYMLSATAKDCSIMIVMKPSETGSEATEAVSRLMPVELDGDRIIVRNCMGFDYSIAVVDLDTKPIEKMEHYFKLDQKIVTMYQQKLDSLSE